MGQRRLRKRPRRQKATHSKRSALKHRKRQIAPPTKAASGENPPRKNANQRNRNAARKGKTNLPLRAKPEIKSTCAKKLRSAASPPDTGKSNFITYRHGPEAVESLWFRGGLKLAQVRASCFLEPL